MAATTPRREEPISVAAPLPLESLPLESEEVEFLESPSLPDSELPLSFEVELLESPKPWLGVPTPLA
jgi:hypothetical protein